VGHIANDSDLHASKLSQAPLDGGWVLMKKQHAQRGERNVPTNRTAGVRNLGAGERWAETGT